MPHDPYRELYIHLPFCVKRCAYCDFTTRAVKRDDPAIDAYVEDLVMQIRSWSKRDELGAIETVYLGGGTPSFLGQRRLDSLLYALSMSCDLTREGMECSMEANPESLDVRLVRDIWALGVNRLSVGVQSFDDDVLQTLGRAHDADAARAAIACAHDRFENVSVDLMCGIPGQTDESFRASVREAVSLGVTHVSIYPLTIEPHTPFYRAILEERLPEPDDDVEARQMEIAEAELRAAGFERYEVASYAKPGFACRHNIGYWTGVPYLGLGASATTMTQNDERRMRMQDGQVTDDLTRAQREAEDVMLGMRMTCGVSDARLDEARPWLPGLDDALAHLCEEGLATHADGRFRPTERGWLCGNDLYGELFDLA
jgi:oxygen-independent coproporphyrinogen-3 oxidase